MYEDHQGDQSQQRKTAEPEVGIGYEALADRILRSVGKMPPETAEELQKVRLDVKSETGKDSEWRGVHRRMGNE